MRLEHINLTVSNIESSYEFYRRLFGLEKSWEGHVEGHKNPVRAMHIGNDALYLALFEAEKPGRAPADYSSPGINHFGLQVESLVPYRKTLASMKIPVHLEGDYAPGERFYFYDPDGTEIELVSY